MDLKLIIILSVIISVVILIYSYFIYLLSRDSYSYRIRKKLSKETPKIFLQRNIFLHRNTLCFSFTLNNSLITIEKMLPYPTYVFKSSFNTFTYRLVVDNEIVDNQSECYNSKRLLYNYVSMLYSNQNYSEL